MMTGLKQLIFLALVFLALTSCIREKVPAGEQPQEKSQAEKKESEPTPQATADVKSEPEEAQDVRPAPTPVREVRQAGNLVHQLKRFRPYIPANTALLVALDLEFFENNQLSGLIMFPDLVEFPAEKLARMYEELRAFHKTRVGFSVKDPVAAVMFVTTDKDLGILLKAEIEYQEAADGSSRIEGLRTLNLPDVPEFPLIDLPEFGLMLYGEGKTPLADYVRSVKAGQIMDDQRFASFELGFKSMSDAWLGAMFDFRNELMSLEEFLSTFQFRRPETALLLMNDQSLRVEVSGDAECLSSIEHLIELGRVQLESTIGLARTRIETMDLFTGSAVIIADNLFQDFYAHLAPSRTPEGNLVFSVRVQSWSMLPMLGIITSIAVPNYIMTLKKARVMEARDNLDKLAKAASSYFCQTHKDEVTGQPLPLHFPITDGAVALEGCCKDLGGLDQDGDGRCDPNPGLWEGQPWAALEFQLSIPHYFSYQYVSNKRVGSEATFKITASADLDCDGNRSSYSIQGRGISDENGCKVELEELSVLNDLE